MNMVEKVARAMFDKACPGIRYHPIDKEWYEEMARAAIEAMRDPTEAMIEVYNQYGHIDIEAYQSMIDAALKE